jgi:CheY-like chemotaxis protein
MKLVAEASNGEEAIEQFRLHRPDVTLMDLQMPALNGIEAVTRTQSHCGPPEVSLPTNTPSVQQTRLSWRSANAACRLHFVAYPQQCYHCISQHPRRTP